MAKKPILNLHVTWNEFHKLLAGAKDSYFHVTLKDNIQKFFPDLHEVIQQKGVIPYVVPQRAEVTERFSESVIEDET